MKYILRYTFLLFLICLLFPYYAGAQRKVSVIGKVTDKDTGVPLSRVSVYNINKGYGTVTDSTGNYKITAGNYDRIVFSYIGYSGDTVRINAIYKNQIIDIQLEKQKYSFAPVDIFGRKPNYSIDSIKRRKKFASALNVNKTNGWGAVEHPISALFDAISGKRKQLWKFQKAYKAYEQRKYIQSRVHPEQIENLFHLKGDSLSAFLLWYSPSYHIVRSATDYELLVDLKKAVKRFRRVYVMKPNMDFENQNVR